jgi:hypothetical protein
MDGYGVYSALLADIPVQRGTRTEADAFSLMIQGKTVVAPSRIYVGEVELREMNLHRQAAVDCLLTRHHDGFVRSRALDRVLPINAPWTMPFIVCLIGEYVIEILDQIDAAFERIDPVALGDFVRDNPAFLSLTRQRVASYWDCYYRRVRRDNYVGFRLIRRLEALAAAPLG